MAPQNKTDWRPATANARQQDIRGAVLGVMIGLLIAVGTLYGARNTPVDTEGGYLVTSFDHPSSVIDKQLVRGDGQAYAALARDPALERPEVFRGGAREAAYRAQRPLLGYLAWAVSFGRPTQVGYALLLVNIGACALVGFALGRIARQYGRSWWLGPGTLLLPGSVVALNWSTSEVLGLGFLGLGLWFWTFRPNIEAATACFIVAALCRETFLLVPAALLIPVLLDWRHHKDVRRVLFLVACPLTWLLWIAIVRLRFGAWAIGVGQGRLGAPFAGLVDAVGGWGPADWVVAAIGVICCAAALARTSREMRWVITAHLLLAALMGELVWARWQDFSRVLSPLFALSLVARPVSLPNARQARQNRLGNPKRP